MSEDLYSQKLAWFKQQEKPELIKIIVAWTSLEARCAEKLTELKGQSENGVWEWLWKNARYSWAELIDKIGIPFSELGLEAKMKPLIGKRILYPDGTVNSYVERYLREQVVKLFDAKSKRPARRS